MADRLEVTDHIVGANRADEADRLVDDLDAKLVIENFEDLLISRTVDDVFPESRFHVIDVSGGDSVVAAQKRLAKHTFLALPVYDSKRHSAFIDRIDIMLAVLEASKHTEPGQSLLAALEKVRVSDIAGKSKRNNFKRIQSNAPLGKAIELMSEWNVRRLAVNNAEGQLVGLLTQSQVVRFIAAAHPSDGGQQKDSGFHETWLSEPVRNGFELLKSGGVAGIAVLDGSKLVGSLSSSDIESVDLQAAATQLDMSFTDFMTNSGHSEIRPPVGVTQSTTLEELFVKVALTKVHRVFVIDQNSEALMGVITLT
eukprot:CAMPEP_0177679072 /NCGR_PEP_ID=MMETSP0447-20121125/29388_1 /TAXON_ID=0 /ORGANISM="Stygamoeba regulata, Strain BSH-02190019" /LENGTH=310 /DNA_ID=CAMNT_0019188199 /DNA_START=3 /DNA_END=930 /DNA_ORIENTATION=+